jgi:hypothetical protein
VPVINVAPNNGVHLAEGVAPGLMHVYCVGPGPAQFGIAIVNPPPPWVWHHLAAGHMLTFQVDGYQAWVFNNGPSRIQLLVADPLLDAVEIADVVGASPIESAA